MPYNRGKVHKVELTGEDKAVLETLAKRHKLSMKEIAGYLIQLCDKYNLLAGDWRERLLDAESTRERYRGLDDACPALTFMDGSFKCVWGRDGKPPAISRLAVDQDEACDACEACNKTLNITLENESYQSKIQDLEMKLKAKADAVFKVPSCMKGSRVNHDCTEFENCPRNYGKPVLIKGYCEKLNDGMGCYDLKKVIVGAESKLK